MRGWLRMARDVTVAARCVATVLALVMTWYFITSDAIRSDNPFLVPDVLLTLLLLGSALLPRHAARPALLFAFGWTAGILSVAWFTHVVRGEVPLGHLIMITASVVMAVLLGRLLTTPRGEEPVHCQRRRLRTAAKAATGAGAAAVTLPLVLVTGFVLLVSPPVEPFEPVAWRPAPGFTVDADRVDPGPAGQIDVPVDERVDGPEDIAVDEAGQVYTGTRDGQILRMSLDLGTVEVFATVGGRPLGLHFHPSGDLIVANHGIGLQAVSPDGDVRLLADTASGEPIRFANDLTVDDDGAIYFSDSNSIYNWSTLGARDSYSLYDFLEGRPRGRLLRHDPATGATTELLSDLYFPNGVVVTADGQAVLVAESTRYRISRYWLDGARAGTSDVFLDNVPGVMDGFTRDDRGYLVLPMYDRVPALDRLVLPREWARQILVRVAESVLTSDDEPLPGSILVLSAQGEVVRHVTGIRPAPSNVVPYRGQWLLGSLSGDQIRLLPGSW